MPRPSLTSRLAGGALLLAALLPVQAQTASHRPPRPPLPPLIVVPPTPEARLPVEVASLSVQATLAGSVARTRIEALLRNPNDRVLEGELRFPLGERQSVSGFALDIDGQLRDAVAVPKAKGRQVFDDVTRQRVDPALLQATRGNAYSLRVFPLPPRGERRVVLYVTEQLRTRDTRSRAAPRLEYRLPLDFAQRVGRFDLDVDLGPGTSAGIGAATARRALLPQAGPDGRQHITWHSAPFEGGDELRVWMDSGLRQPVVHTQEFRGRTYAHVEVPVAQGWAPRPVPRRVALVWDASGSSAQRDRAAELQLIDRWLRGLRNVSVQLKLVRDVAEPLQAFEVRNGDWSALRRVLEQAQPDGATAGGELAPPSDADLALVVTDGLDNYGEAGVPLKAAMPTYVAVSGRIGDTAALRRLAEDSGAELLDLSALRPDEAHARLGMRRSRVAALEGEGIGELVAQSLLPQDGRVQVAGVLSRPQAVLRVWVEDAKGQRTLHEVPVVHGDGSAPSARSGVAAQQFARLRLAQLAAAGPTRSAEMERLGLHFGMVTPRTSLIVLDSAADYARHGIEPPAGEPALVAQVRELALKRQASEAQAVQAQLQRVKAEFAQRVAWWEKDFPKDSPAPEPGPRPVGAVPSGAPAPRPAEQAEAAADRRAADASRARMAPSPMAPPSPVAPSAPPPPVAPGTAPQATIALRKWQPDSPYARRMRAAEGAQAYAVYLDERPSYLDSTAFFLDAADILAEKQQPALALRVLSNLAEMNLEDRHILRILAYRLLQAGQPQAALPLLERVLELAPDEPQSWRDLAQLLATLGRPQRAVDLLWHVVATPWHGRFPGIELIALTELNAIAARAQAKGEAVDLQALPPELRRNLPLALRTVLTWDADNTDIDLWVTDPNGERAFYGHRLTHQGGQMSRDFTGGYGPEEFSLKAPKPGTYKVQAQFYGHRQQIVAPATTLMLQLTTSFGTPQESSRLVTLRLSGAREVVEVGEFEVAGP